MSVHASLVVAAGALTAAFLGLGIAVSRETPNHFDAQATSTLRGRLAKLALLFTRSGRSRELTILGTIAILAFAAVRVTVLIPVLMIVSQLLSQALAETLKRSFRRPRPAELLLHKKDIGYSYPSGHAVTAIVFFAGWGVLALDGTLPNGLKLTLATLLFVWAAGVLWSRIALSAHYVTDVLGGILLGSAWLCTFLALGLGYVRP